jgi:F-type H+-transporting ATPase subunit epsilon
MAELDCEILTPEGRVYEGRVQMVVVPGAEGELGVLPRHAPIIARLKVGEVRVKLEGNEWRSWAINEGYFKMQFDKATVLVEDAVAATDIDVEQAGADAEDARSRIAEAAGGDSELDRFRAERDLQYAENRIEIAGR